MQRTGAVTLLAFFVGLLIGVVGTFGHRGVIGADGVNLPWGIVVALLGAACYLIGLRLYTEGRLPTLAGAIGLLLPVFVFSFEGPGGSVIIAQGALGRLWEFGPAFLAVGVLAWPRLPARPGGEAGQTEQID
ncbi:MAG TPA: hypothetical protein VGC45_14545 [Gryllotalpicola sp.]